MFVPLVLVFHDDNTLAMLLPNFRELENGGGKKKRKKEGEGRNGGTADPRANCRKRASCGKGRVHGAHTREDPLTFFQYEAQRDEQALRVGLREELSSRMQKYLRVLVKGLFMHV